MALDPKELAHWHAAFAKYQQDLAGIVEHDPSPFKTVAETIGFLVACARAGGCDEANALERVELFMHLVDLDRAAIRQAEATLRPLGYVAVAALLKQLARHARKLKPRISALERNKRRKIVAKTRSRRRAPPGATRH